MIKKIEYHKGSVTAVQLTSQDVLVTGTYLNILNHLKVQKMDILNP